MTGKHFANWSSDGQYPYRERWGDDTGAMRIRLRDRSEEKIGFVEGIPGARLDRSDAGAA